MKTIYFHYLKRSTCTWNNEKAVLALTSFRRKVYGDGGDDVIGRVVVELRHKQVVVLHAQGKLLHV